MPSKDGMRHEVDGAENNFRHRIVWPERQLTGRWFPYTKPATLAVNQRIYFAVTLIIAKDTPLTSGVIYEARKVTS